MTLFFSITQRQYDAGDCFREASNPEVERVCCEFRTHQVTPQVRHPERVFLRGGSPCSGTVFNIPIDINRPTQDSMH